MPRKPKTDGDHYYDPFPSRLRFLMVQRGVKQADLVPVLGFRNRQSVTGYITGKTVPTSEKIVALSQYFHVSADYLLGLSDSPSTVLKERAVLDYTGLSHSALQMIVWAKNEGCLDAMEMFIKDRSLLKAGVNLRAAARAAAEAASIKDYPPDDLMKKQELFDLNVFRVTKCAETIASGTYKMAQLGHAIREIERKWGQPRSQNKDTVNSL